MRKIIILGGIIMLIYLKNSMTTWSLSTDTANVISHDILTTISAIPPYIILVMYYLFIVMAILSLFRNRRSIVNILIYMIAFIILTLGFKITGNLLCFEDYTHYAFIKIYHPISLEAKQHYLFMQLDLLLRHNHPDVYMNPAKLEWHILKLREQLLEIDWSTFKDKSPSEINQYACNMLNNCNSTILGTASKLLIVTALIVGCAISVEYLYNSMVMLIEFLKNL